MNYLRHFGLREPPFGITPDTHYFYACRSPQEALETVRLLTNLETEKRKLLQVVLFGQPELDRKLQSPSLRQLLQRITFQHRLAGLVADELKGYLAHRLSIAGYTREFAFTGAAVTAIHRASRGVPRLVNIIAHKALLVVYGEGGRRVGLRHVQAASEDTPAAAALGRWWLPRFGRALD